MFRNILTHKNSSRSTGKYAKYGLEIPCKQVSISCNDFILSIQEG